MPVTKNGFGPSFFMGGDTLKVSMKLFEKNRKRLCTALKDQKNLPKKSFVLLQGGQQINQDSTDVELVFRQESYFQWCYGVTEPDFYGAIDIDSGASILFIPRLPESYLTWSGKIYPPSHFRSKYLVDECYYTDEIKDILVSKNAENLLTLNGINTDSDLSIKGAHFEGIDKFEVESKILHPVISELRVIKTEEELQVLRYVNDVSSEGHKKIMKKIKPGWMEYQAESLFKFHCYTFGGCRHVSYTCIGASGENCSVLHYGHAAAPNDKLIRDGDMCLFDMGAEYYCYSSDITCSFPVNGKFTQQQKDIYNAVLKANRAVQNAMKPGVSWVDMHLLADRVQLEELIKIGLIKGDIEKMMEARLGALFMPHGLGHLMGHDVHDVGGYPEDGPKRSSEKGLCSLRTARRLLAGMVLTIEPGIYFNPSTIASALKDPKLSVFLIEEEINKFLGFGGVRIEDDVVVTETGIEMLTKVPRDVEDIEALMAEGLRENSNSDLSPVVKTQLTTSF